MLILDDREIRSKDGKPQYGIYDELAKLDIEVVVHRLEQADCEFEGYGESGPAIIGCERKKLGDLIGCIKDRRLAGRQLRLMLANHTYVYLFVEGLWRPGSVGELEEWKSSGREGKGWYPVYGRGDTTAITYRQVVNYLSTMENLAGVVVRRTADAKETAHQYVALWKWFQKEWTKHKSHDQIYVNQVAVGGKRALMRELGKRKKPSVLWMMLAQLPGLDEKAKEAARYFGSVRGLAGATVRDWQMVPGVGKELAERFVRLVREEMGDGQD